MVTRILSATDFRSVQVRLSHDENVTAAHMEQLIDIDGGFRRLSGFNLRHALLAALRLMDESWDLMQREANLESANRVQDRKRAARNGFPGEIQFHTYCRPGRMVEQMSAIVLQASIFKMTLLNVPVVDGQPEKHLLVEWDAELAPSDRPQKLFELLGITDSILHEIRLSARLGGDWCEVSDPEQTTTVYLLPAQHALVPEPVR